ncbi:HAD family hydrolase [Pseudomonadota bacterium]
MVKPYELIVFDWDGTLMDSVAKIVASLRAAAVEAGLPALKDEQLRNVIGLGMQEAFEALYPNVEEKQQARFVDSYRHHFVVVCPKPEALFEGVRELLNALSQQPLRLGVATGKSRKGLDRVLANTGCGGYFHATRCADESRSKPNPHMLLELIEELGVEPDKTLMIGDSEYDMAMANAAGTDALAVTYGVHEPQRLGLHEPLAMIDSVAALEEWFNINSLINPKL